MKGNLAFHFFVCENHFTLFVPIHFVAKKEQLDCRSFDDYKVVI